MGRDVNEFVSVGVEAYAPGGRDYGQGEQGCNSSTYLVLGSGGEVARVGEFGKRSVTDGDSE